MTPGGESDRRRAWPRLCSIAVVVATMLAVYVGVIRPPALRWGATDDEIRLAMPGDELVSDPDLLATRAITIDERPERVWPWLVQMGHGRAGFYGHDLLENLGSPRGIRSADRIIPELQDIKAGDRIYMSAPFYLLVDSIERNRVMVWVDPATPPTSALTWALYPLPDGRTRLVSRVRLRYHWTKPIFIVELFTELFDHVAVRRVLLGVKDRAEGRVEPIGVQATEVALGFLGLFELVFALVLIWIRAPWWRAMVVALGTGAVTLFAIYVHHPLWLAVALEVGVLGVLVGMFSRGRRARPTSTDGVGEEA